MDNKNNQHAITTIETFGVEQIPDAERNATPTDLFRMIFGGANTFATAVLGSFPVLFGLSFQAGAWAIGLGVLVYGVIYTLVHDGLVHQRWFRWVPRKGYAKRLVQAHKLHHATIGKEGGVSFGFVFARDPLKLKAELKAQREAGLATVRESAGD